MRKYSEMKYYIAIPIFLVVFLLQTTITNHWEVLGYSPNLLLCLVVVFSFLYHQLFGLVLGVAFGIVLDVATKPIVGIESISFLLAFIIAISIASFFSTEKILPCIVAGLLATIGNIFIKLAFYKLAGFMTSVHECLMALRVELIYNSVFVIIFYAFFVRSIVQFKKDKSFQGGYWYS